MPPKAPAKAPAKAKVKAQPALSAQPPTAQVAPLDAAPESILPKVSPGNSPRNDLEAEPKAERLEDVQETQGAGDASNHEKLVKEQIDLDLPRTFPNTPEVDSRRATIRNVLLTYSRSNPHIGYCQGMSFPAAVLCANLSESAANARFQSCLEKVRELWLPGFHIFETVKQAFDALLAHQSQALAQSLQAQDVILDVFLLDAWLTMFARWLPFKMLFRVLDFVESSGLCRSIVLDSGSGELSLPVHCWREGWCHAAALDMFAVGCLWASFGEIARSCQRHGLSRVVAKEIHHAFEVTESFSATETSHVQIFFVK